MYMLLILIAALALMATSGGVDHFIDVASLIFVVIIPIFGVMASGMLKDFLRFSKLAFARNTFYTRHELEATGSSLQLFKKLTLASGIFGTLTGVISMLRYTMVLEEVVLGTTVALLTTVYAIIIWIILTSLEYKVKREIIRLEQEVE